MDKKRKTFVRVTKISWRQWRDLDPLLSENIDFNILIVDGWSRRTLWSNKAGCPWQSQTPTFTDSTIVPSDNITDQKLLKAYTTALTTEQSISHLHAFKFTQTWPATLKRATRVLNLEKAGLHKKSIMFISIVQGLVIPARSIFSESLHCLKASMHGGRCLRGWWNDNLFRYFQYWHAAVFRWWNSSVFTAIIVVSINAAGTIAAMNYPNPKITALFHSHSKLRSPQAAASMPRRSCKIRYYVRARGLRQVVRGKSIHLSRFFPCEQIPLKLGLSWLTDLALYFRHRGNVHVHVFRLRLLMSLNCVLFIRAVSHVSFQNWQVIDVNSEEKLSLS